jgi:hypothetical protein
MNRDHEPEFRGRAERCPRALADPCGPPRRILLPRATLMARATIWLGREVEQITLRWLQGLEGWQPFPSALTADADRHVCAICVAYSSRMLLDEVPHALLHDLVEPIDLLVKQSFVTVAAERHEDLNVHQWLEGQDDWAGADPDPETHGWSLLAAAAVESELLKLYSDLLKIAVDAVLRHHPAIVRAVQAHVEPALQRFADQLIREVCGP